LDAAQARTARYHHYEWRERLVICRVEDVGAIEWWKKELTMIERPPFLFCY
jgi:hypothetical protein